MFCSKCGTQNPDDASFCNKCGNNLSSIKPPEIEMEEEGEEEEIERKGITGKLGKMGVYGFRSGKKWKMAIAISVYFVLGIVIFLIPSAVMSTFTSPTSPTTLNEFQDKSKEYAYVTQTATPTVAIPTIVEHGIYRDYNEQAGYPIDKTVTFTNLDKKTVSWITLKNMKKGDVITWEYYSPDGALYHKDITEFNWSGTGWWYYPLKGFAGLQGQWRVVIYINGVETATDSFYVAPLTTKMIEEIKNKSTTVRYDNLMRYNEKYVGKTVFYRGKIVQVSEVSKNNYVLRIATRMLYSDDIIWVEYKGERLLENDIVDVWGEIKGLKTYTAVLGNTITIPEIDSLHVELVRKAG